MSLNGKLSSIHKNYHTLTAHERFLAVMEAHGRGDETELMNLVHACPTREYLAAEHPYTQRLDAARRLGDLIVFDVLARVAGGYLALDLGEERKKMELVLHGEGLILGAAAMWQGFKLFCEDIGVRNFDAFLLYNSYGVLKEGGKLSGRENQAALIFDMFLGLLDFHEPDPEEVEAARRGCHDFWKFAINTDYNGI